MNPEYMNFGNQTDSMMQYSAVLPMNQTFLVVRKDRLGGEVACESDIKRFWGKGIWNHNTSQCIGIQYS
jgi:hypothetical protein